MGSVIEFPAERAVPGNGAECRLQAEVVIFPGVRIERREFSLADRVASRSKHSAPAVTAVEADSA
jgi:hypothetical protein